MSSRPARSLAPPLPPPAARQVVSGPADVVVQPPSPLVQAWRYWNSSLRRQLTGIVMLLVVVSAAAFMLVALFAAFTTNRSADQTVSAGTLRLVNGYTSVEQTVGPLAPGDRGERLWNIINAGSLDAVDFTIAAQVTSYSDSAGESSTATQFTDEFTITIDWCTTGFDDTTGDCEQWSTTPLLNQTLSFLSEPVTLALPLEETTVLAGSTNNQARSLPLRIRYHFADDPSGDVEGAGATVLWRFQAGSTVSSTK